MNAGQPHEDSGKGASAPAASPGASDRSFDEHAAERRGTPDPGRKPKPSASGSMGDAGSREQRVREEAYRRYLARAGNAGSDVTDWLEAEAEVDRVAQQAADPP